MLALTFYLKDSGQVPFSLRTFSFLIDSSDFCIFTHISLFSVLLPQSSVTDLVDLRALVRLVQLRL